MHACMHTFINSLTRDILSPKGSSVRDSSPWCSATQRTRQTCRGQSTELPWLKVRPPLILSRLFVSHLWRSFRWKKKKLIHWTPLRQSFYKRCALCVICTCLMKCSSSHKERRAPNVNSRRTSRSLGLKSGRQSVMRYGTDRRTHAHTNQPTTKPHPAKLCKYIYG